MRDVIVLRLRDKADSYRRDADVLRDQGDESMAISYRAVADELRKCADEIAKP